MTTTRRRKKRWRTWLEPRARDEVDSYAAVTKYTWGGVELKIADCDRRVTLSFYPNRLDYSREKLNRLRSALDMVDKYLDEAHAERSDD